MKIFKYPIAIVDQQEIFMPRGAKLLCVQSQYDKPNIWAMVDPSETTEQRTIFIRGTGHDLGSAAEWPC